MRDEDTLACIIDFANRSFRDSADQDYIMARQAYRMQLDSQFRWNSLQAVEKYLKAILLYNERSTIGIIHNLVEALKRVRDIADLQFDVPKRSEDYIEYLDTYGEDRYLSYPTHLPFRALVQLDETIWSIRRYCYFMRQEFRRGEEVINLLEPNKKKLASIQYKNFPNRYRISNGYLEKVLAKRLPAYDALVWKNPFFGKVAKHKITMMDRFSATNPTHFSIPECFETLNKLVQFPKDVKKKFSSSI
jgi:HEPN domain-containing protein